MNVFPWANKKEESPEQINNNVEQTASFTSGNPNENSSVVQLRLDTSPVLNQIRTYLTGKVTTYRFNERTQQDEMITITVSPEICNSLGVQRLMLKLEMLFNAHLSQGDLEPVYYYWVAEKFREEIPSYILVNRYLFGIDPENVNEVINNIIWVTTIFLTQAINGGTRTSLSGGSFKVQESRMIGGSAPTPKLFG